MSQWKKVKIGDIFAIEKGSLQSSKNTEGEYDFITAAAEWKTHNSYDHDCEAIVYAVAASGSLGRAHYVNGKFIASDLCFILTEKDKNKYPINFLFYQIVFEMLRDEIVSKTKTGTSKESINRGNFSNYEIPYFSIEFQLANYQRFVDAKNQIQLLNEESEKQKELPPITDEEKPFEIPEGWKWVRLGEIVDSVVYGTSSKCSYDSNQNSAILRIPNISLGYVDDSDLKYTNLSESEKNELSLKENDLLVIRSNGSPEIVGKMVYVPKKYENLCYAGYLIRLRFTASSIGFYIGNISNAKLLRNQIEEPLRSTVGINNINSDEIKSLMFPLPPLVEQTEIIQVIGENLKKVDKLGFQIQEREAYIKQLMQSILKDAFEERS